MLDNFIPELIRKQRPYYLPQGNPIKGINHQYWLVFQHRDADNPLHNVIKFLGMGNQNATHKLLRIDPKTAKVFEYIPLKEGDLPSVTLLRTCELSILEKFLHQERVTTEPALLAGSFLEIPGRQRRFNLPPDLDKYRQFFTNILQRTKIYRRSTAYFDSGVLKLYQEPLAAIVQTEGQIRLLMDWQGFTKLTDIAELDKLYNQSDRYQFIQRTLEEFLQGLAEGDFTETEILAELVRLGFLQIRLIKMDSGKALYHKKTGIFTDQLDHHIQHEGSDNFTRAAHSRNAESMTFLYSWDELDAQTILDSIQQFDGEWQDQELSFDLSQEFLQQVLRERQRRQEQQKPVIESITPDKFPSGETTTVEITGQNLDQVTDIGVTENELVKVNIHNQSPQQIIGEVEVNSDHPPIPLTQFQVKTPRGVYRTTPKKPPVVSQSLVIPDFEEIPGFKSAIEMILAGNHGTPDDFLYWLAKKRPQQFRVQGSDLLDELLNQSILFEHQKTGAQHCLRVMQDFGVAVCADAVGLGKTRLAAAVGRLYRQQHPDAKIAIIAAKKLLPNWERELRELGFKSHDCELYNKNLMSRQGSNFLENLDRYGGPDLIIIDEAHEGIRNYNNRIHKTCLQIQDNDRKLGKQRHFLLLTATPWNNRREDIYNILSPFISRPEAFQDLNLPAEVTDWFTRRDTGVRNFTDNTEIFRQIYKELFLQRTRKMLRESSSNLNVYAQRIAEWLPVQFENTTEEALDQIFTHFETSLYIPFADPIRYLTSNVEQRSLLGNQRRFFLQRAESSMYALSQTINNFRRRITQMQSRLQSISPDAAGLKEFLLTHYEFNLKSTGQTDRLNLDDDERETWDEEYEEEEEAQEEQPQKRQQLRRSIDINTAALENQPDRARQIYDKMLADCDNDLQQLQEIQTLLQAEFVIDHKKEQVRQKVRELVKLGHKVLLISTFSDTVIDYYLYMAQDQAIASQGIGMLTGSPKLYYPNNADQPQKISPGQAKLPQGREVTLTRQEIFKLFAPVASCKHPTEYPQPEAKITVLIGSETLSVGQNLQDADYLINIDLPWNPMILEQRIGRIDRPKKHQAAHIYIYYANSESQLLRQASRLANLHKKLVGELADQDTQFIDVETKRHIPTISHVNSLRDSIYGDTLFDDEILPGYVDFLQSLVKARKLQQNHLQEQVYQKQATHLSFYTENEILHSEEISKLLKRLGEDYQPNPIVIGRRTGEVNEPTGLAVLTLAYFGPNGEPIAEKQQTLFWNDQTGEKDGYGMAIASAMKTPVISNTFSVNSVLSSAQSIYQELVKLKHQYIAELQQPENLTTLNTSSERINKIQRRLRNIPPRGNLTPTLIKNTLRKLSYHKYMIDVQKLLINYTEGSKARLDDNQFVTQLVEDTDNLSLLLMEGIKPTSLSISVSALLLRM